MPIAAHAKHATAAAQASDWPQLPPTKRPQTILVVDDRSIHAVHVDVGDDEVQSSSDGHFPGLLSRLGLAHDVAEMLQQTNQKIAIDGPVVHDQDGLRTFGRRKLRPVRGLGSGSRVFGMGCDGHAVQRKKWMYLSSSISSAV